MKNFTKRMRNSRITQTRRVSQKWKQAEINGTVPSENIPSSKNSNALAKKKITEVLQKDEVKKRKKLQVPTPLNLIKPTENKKEMVKKRLVSSIKNNAKKKVAVKKSSIRKKVHEETHSTGNFFIER